MFNQLTDRHPRDKLNNPGLYGLLGFPFTPSFIGIDLLFSHIHKQEILLVVFVALSFIFMELAVIRIYARIFLGQHKKNYHAVAFRST